MKDLINNSYNLPDLIAKPLQSRYKIIMTTIVLRVRGPVTRRDEEADHSDVSLETL